MDNPGLYPSAAEPVAVTGFSPAYVWLRLSGNRAVTAAGLAALAFVLLALLVPVLPLQDPLATNYDASLSAPAAGHLLGTDLHGRDELSRVLWASRTSLMVGVMATALAVAAGVAAGGAAGYSGRFMDAAIMRTADVFLSFPVIIGAIAVMVIFGPGRNNVFIAIAFFGWPIFARVCRSSVLSVRERGFVKAAQGLGASRSRIFFKHVGPNSVGPLVSYASMMVAGAIMAEAGLSFINLGVQPPYPSWGLMMSEAMGEFEQAPWLVIVPGAAITLTALIFILLGAGVTTAANPHRADSRQAHRRKSDCPGL